MSSNSRPLIVGNWKMNGVSASLNEIGSIASSVVNEPPEADIAICPPNTLVAAAATVVQGSPIVIGAQDCHWEPFGSFTGDTSAEMLADAGARLVILGHSERRVHHQETDQQVAAKVRAAVRVGMAPVICVGETHEQRLAGQTMAVVEAALLNSAPSMLASCGFAVAYEPRWAIGSGRTASLADIGEVHALIREILASRFGENGRRANILYGGSVTGTNARAILRTAEVGGVLVGGASLSAREFSNILRAATA